MVHPVKLIVGIVYLRAVAAVVLDFCCTVVLVIAVLALVRFTVGTGTL